MVSLINTSIYSRIQHFINIKSPISKITKLLPVHVTENCGGDIIFMTTLYYMFCLMY